MSGFRLMAIHAHPDDESSKGAATMARYAREGNEVMVVTCTGGERGDILNPAMNKPEVVANISRVRNQEMAHAASILGVQHRWLGYIDSGLPEGDPLPPLPEGCFALADTIKATDDLVRVIREFKPHVIITYDENGGYPHPDHIKTHAISVRAWKVAGQQDYKPELGEPWVISKMYYVHGFVKRRFEVIHEDFIRRGLKSPYEERFARNNNAPDMFERVTTQVAASQYFPLRDDALRAHATQIDPNGFFFAVPLEDQQRLWPTEDYELAATRVPVNIPEDDLFVGINPDSDHQPDNIDGFFSPAAKQAYA